MRWAYLHDLWQPESGALEIPLRPTWSHPFKLCLPPAVADHTSSVKELPQWRVKWWLDVHVYHNVVVGSRTTRQSCSWPLEIRDHRAKVISRPPSPVSSGLLGTGSTTVQVSIPPIMNGYGPAETVPFAVGVHPVDPRSEVVKVAVALERRFEQLDRTDLSSPGRPTIPPQKRLSSLLRGVSNTYQQLLNEDDRGTTTVIGEAPLLTSDTANWTGCLCLPSRARGWDLGETEQADLAKVSFGYRIKITIKSRNGTKEIVSGLAPVVILGVTAEERAAASLAAEGNRPSSASSAIYQQYRRGSLASVGPSEPSVDLPFSPTTSAHTSPPYDQPIELRSILKKAPESRGSSVPPSPQREAVTLPLPPVSSILWSSNVPGYEGINADGSASGSAGEGSRRGSAVYTPGSFDAMGLRRRFSRTVSSSDEEGAPLRSRPRLWGSAEHGVSTDGHSPSLSSSSSPSRQQHQRHSSHQLQSSRYFGVGHGHGNGPYGHNFGNQKQGHLPSLGALGISLPHNSARPATAPHPYRPPNPDKQRPRTSGDPYHPPPRRQ